MVGESQNKTNSAQLSWGLAELGKKTNLSECSSAGAWQSFKFQDLIEMTLRKMDLDKDGVIGFDDFEFTVMDEPLLLEAFGKCLPTEEYLDKYLKFVLDRKKGIQGLKNFYLGLT